MTIAILKIESNATARQEILAAKDLRTLIARQLGVDIKRVTGEAHFADDLGPTGWTAWKLNSLPSNSRTTMLTR
jgi:hypothetical protein